MKNSIFIIVLAFVFAATLNAQSLDSLLRIAEIEYEKKEFSKTRELCELALSLNPNLGEAHNLIGKVYVLSSEICDSKENAHQIKEDVLWVAMDEWEKAISKPNSKKEEALKLISRYKNYLPTAEHFRTCFTRATLKEGDEYFVECWIQRKTKVRLKEF